MKNIKLQNYSTWTAHALVKIKSDFMASKRFNDTEGTVKILVLLTDGK